MSKKDLDRIKRQILEDRQRLLDSVPEDKRLELERLAELDIPQFMRDWERRINEARRRYKTTD
jgi:hypothetical protein